MIYKLECILRFDQFYSSNHCLKYRIRYSDSSLVFYLFELGILFIPYLNKVSSSVFFQIFFMYWKNTDECSDIWWCFLLPVWILFCKCRLPLSCLRFESKDGSLPNSPRCSDNASHLKTYVRLFCLLITKISLHLSVISQLWSYIMHRLSDS